MKHGIIVSNLPNAISVGRLLAVPVMVWLIVSDRMNAAFWLFVAAGVSDGVDGFIAKRFHVESELGRFLDPIADKVMLVCMYITLGVEDYIATWIVILVVFRDALIIGGALLSQVLDHPVSIRPLYISKINTVAQIVLAAVVLAELSRIVPEYPLVEILEYVVAVTTAASGGVYLARWLSGTGKLLDAASPEVAQPGAGGEDEPDDARGQR